MSASQIDFYPHQFKPVLRFIDSPTNRLLLADEVGLGKTIEAGLIWTEWQARQDARRLLIICPPSLCPKWERELVDRFQLPARVLTIDDLATLQERYVSHGRKLNFVGICSYQTLSPKKKGNIINDVRFNEKALLDALMEPTRSSNTQIPDIKV
jgi:SNF2 family DNA or RNA helicase